MTSLKSILEASLRTTTTTTSDDDNAGETKESTTSGGCGQFTLQFDGFETEANVVLTSAHLRSQISRVLVVLDKMKNVSRKIMKCYTFFLLFFSKFKAVFASFVSTAVEFYGKLSSSSTTNKLLCAFYFKSWNVTFYELLFR
jgi:hypothetical protein